MKRLVLILVVTGLVNLGFLTFSNAATTKKTKLLKLKGEVVSINETNNEVIISVSSKKSKKKTEETISTDSNTIIKKASKNVEIVNLVPGDKVEVKYEVSEGIKIAKNIIVKANKKAKKAVSSQQ